ncbi:endonuclease/exonuclease/phosphatase family protein [Candidatus Saccharibacteria bacterium]|nr:endonuclease/exonuclease/phosphatase family protein [Candidatus Saccharibacteria bacterium]HPR09593.1 endonuclease/exonuclease/phosphatase family protein [Candidatus Saccharibacteria bacterium]
MAPPEFRLMKLMQLNVWLGRLTPQIVRLIEQESPDIICCQEVFSAESTVVFPDNMFDVLQQMTAAGGYPHVFFSPLWQMAIADTTAQMGNAILSRYPLSQQETIFLSGVYNPNLTAETRVSNTRNAQFCKIDTPAGKLSLVNYHGWWEATPVGSATSVEKMQLVADKARTLSMPLIIAGDLNVDPTSPAMRVFDGFLEDLTATHTATETLSQLGKVRDVACDHILVSDGVRVEAFTVRDELVSDHRALVLEFSLS